MNESIEYGIRCPKCNDNDARVIDVRDGRGYVRRRNECACGKRWTTYEFFSPRKGVIAIPRDTRAIRGLST